MRTYLLVYKNGATVFIQTRMQPDVFGWLQHMPTLDYWQEWKVKDD